MDDFIEKWLVLKHAHPGIPTFVYGANAIRPEYFRDRASLDNVRLEEYFSNGAHVVFRADSFAVNDVYRLVNQHSAETQAELDEFAPTIKWKPCIMIVLKNMEVPEE